MGDIIRGEFIENSNETGNTPDDTSPTKTDERSTGIASGVKESAGTSSEITGKRKPGRPRKNQNSAAPPTDTVSVIQAGKVDNRKKPRSAKPEKMSLKDATLQAESLLAIIEAIAVTGFGEQARFNVFERTLLSTSLPITLSSLEISTIERTSGILAPLALLTGAAFYGIRLVQLAKDKSETQSNEISRHDEQTIPQTRENNHQTTEDIWTKIPLKTSI